MERYKNLGGKSGVTAYEIAQGAITIQFKNGAVYLYNNQRPGFADVAEMQRLAAAGLGLNSFINRYVRDRYAQRLR